MIAESVTRLKTEYYTLAEAFRAGGYATGHFGKWHLGPEPYSPLEHGFQHDFPHHPGPGPAGSYRAPWRFNPVLNIIPATPDEHIEDRDSDEAVAWLRAHKDKPFFLNYWAFSVHAPYDQKRDVKPEKLSKYANKSRPDAQQRHPVMGGMVESLDEAVGKLLAALEELGLADKTLVVFTSDNGGVHWAGHNKGYGYDDIPITSNEPLKGGKATIYEGGIRVPCLVRWPGVTQPGAKTEALAMSVDWYATLLEIAGLAPQAGQVTDGVSLVPVLKQQGASRQEVFVHFPHGGGIRPGFAPSTSLRVGDWKLIRFYCDNDDGSDRHELYNLKEDIGEVNDLSPIQPLRVRQMSERLEVLLKETGAVVPKINPVWKAPAGGSVSADGVPDQTGKDINVAKSPGGLRIVSTGNDPWVVWRNLPAGIRGPVSVEFRLKTDIKGSGQVYWATQTKKAFAGQFVAFELKAGDTARDYRAGIPATDSDLTALRLDPGNGAGGAVLEWLVIKDPAGRVLKEWRFGS